MSIKIKIELSSGKEIELSEEEYEELKGVFTQKVVIDPVPYIPIYPSYPWNPCEPNVWWNNTITYESKTVGALTTTTTEYGNGIKITTASIGEPTEVDAPDATNRFGERIIYSTTTGNNWD